MSISPRGLGLLTVSAALALILPRELAALLFGVVLVVIVTDSFLVRRPPSVVVTMPPILSRGVPSTVGVTTSPSNGVRAKMVGTADLRIEPNEGLGGFTATATAVRRGAHVLAAPATITTGPLGFGQWYHRVGTETSVVVYPDMPAARHIATEVRLGRFGDSARRTRGPLGLGTELESIRDYLPDDDIRQVNWRATARTGSPMSNTYRIEQEREVIVVLDTGRLMSAPVGDETERTRLDVAVDAAAALAAVADVVGDRIGLVAFDERIRRRISTRRDGGDALVTAIYDLEPTSADSDFELAFRTIAHEKRAFVLVLTDLLEETAARPLLDAMPILGRHHAVAVAGVTDPAVRSAVATPSDTIGGAFQTAVAIDIEASRRKVATMLSGLGATVIDVDAGLLPARCVAAYLRAKKRARL